MLCDLAHAFPPWVAKLLERDRSLSALDPFNGEPAIEGVNVLFADKVAPVVRGGCSRKEKKIAYWRKHFVPLSDILHPRSLSSWWGQQDGRPSNPRRAFTRTSSHVAYASGVNS